MSRAGDRAYILRTNKLAQRPAASPVSRPEQSATRLTRNFNIFSEFSHAALTTHSRMRCNRALRSDAISIAARSTERFWLEERFNVGLQPCEERRQAHPRCLDLGGRHRHCGRAHHLERALRAVCQPVAMGRG